MAQLVCINKDSYREGINKIGDIVAIHDDNVELTGSGYSGLDIIKVEGMTAKEVGEKLVRAEHQTKEYWTVGEDWYEIKEQPKYSFCIDVLTSDDLIGLESKELTVDNTAILAKLKDNVSLETKNNETKLILQ